MKIKTSKLAELRYCKILIVDDSRAFREKIRYVLNDAEIGYYYYEAVDGRDGVSQYVNYEPDIVIMDIMMPNVDGIKAIKTIINYDPDARIIVASTRENKELVEDAIKGGAKDFIIKPFQPGAIVMAVTKQFVSKNNQAKKECKFKEPLPTIHIDKPLLYKGTYHGHVVNIDKSGRFELSANTDQKTKELLKKAVDIQEMGKHYEIIL